MGRTFEIRDPIHGFITINDWEREIINHPVFQRLRRIKQLAWTDMVYPGAVHTRFEHSLGVMHVATKMFEAIVERKKDYLIRNFHFDEHGLGRDKILLRLTALLHDLGHSPFSHAGEGLMLINPETGKPFKHETYSAAVIEYILKDIVENHPLNQNYRITTQEISDFLNGNARLGRSLLWRDLVSSQLDADRADYLLRDSYHIGVRYGQYDLNRLLVTLTVTTKPDTGAPVIAIDKSGFHAAEGLILARYQMFTQVYFQHTRRAYDYHIAGALKEILQKDDDLKEFNGSFPPPTSKENLERYVLWDDWKVLGKVAEGFGGIHGQILKERNHARSIFETPEIPGLEDIEKANILIDKLGELIAFVDEAESSWYKFGDEDLEIVYDSDTANEVVLPLSTRSSLVRGLKPIKQKRIYVYNESKHKARLLINKG